MGSGVHVADFYLSPEFDPNDCGFLTSLAMERAMERDSCLSFVKMVWVLFLAVSIPMVQMHLSFSVCASAHTPCSVLDCESMYCLWMCAFGRHLKRSTRYHL